MNRTNKLFKDAIRSGGFRPMEQAGVYDPMEQAGHRDSILVSSVLNLLKDKVVVEKVDLEKLVAIASSKEIPSADALKLIEEKLKNMIPLTVRMVAEVIIKGNKDYYSEALLKLIPPELLETELIDENLHKIGEKINQICLQKEEELATMLHLPPLAQDDNYRERLEGIICSASCGLNKEQQEKVKEIKFLNNVAQTTIAQ